MQNSRFKQVFLWLMAAFYTVAGINHFLMPVLYLSVMPPYLPFPLLLVYFSGLAETSLGILLLIPRFSRLAAWGIIALLVAIFPANIEMFLHPDRFPQIPEWIFWVRLPLQAELIGWAYWFTKLPDAL